MSTKSLSLHHTIKRLTIQLPELEHVYIYISLCRGRHGAPASTPSPSRGACVAFAVGRHVVGGERDVAIGQELAEDLGHHATGLCKLEDEVHVAGGLLFFLSTRFTFL